MSSFSSLNEGLECLIDKYKNNPYALNRIQTHISQLLPATLENECVNYEKRIQRNNQLTSDQDSFIEVFLTKYTYFFLSSNNSYYHYDGESYSLVSEEQLNHTVLTNISQNELIAPWKYKTKMNIIKKIKDRPLFRSIPESETIQNVLKIFMPFFECKEDLKYFLIILGDALLKKYADEDSLYFLLVSNDSKPRKMLNEIDSIIYNKTSICNLTKEAGIVTKYHTSYDYKMCRILKIKKTFDNEDFQNFDCINFLCVCAYYSDRYVNSEAFLFLKDDILKEKVLFLQSKSVHDIFNDFFNKSFEESNTFTSWKDIHYLWKSYASINCLPNNIIYLNHLKTLFKNNYIFNEAKDGFDNITSKLLPKICCFIEFWENHIVADESSELEIDEIVSIYKMKTNYSISDEMMVSIINHYFPGNEILENKYILNVSTDLWSKSEDIINVLKTVKDSSATLISIDSLYSIYTKQKFKLHTSKRFFKKFIETHMSEFIEVEKCLNLNLLHSKLTFLESVP